MAISHNPNNPITRPLSLLHLGYNTGAVAITPGTDGWRSWMDIGMFTTNGTDNVYLGLKDEGGLSGDRQDAVLSWGDNQVSGIPPGNGPDNFRMIFTSTTASSGGGTPPATGVNGLEGMRMTPTATKGIYTGIGGDPTANQYGPAGNSINPTATLEVNSWGVTSTPGGNSGLRFTNLQSTTPTIANPGTGVLSVDANGDVIYVTGGSGGIGNVCGGTPNPLTADTEIPLGGYMLNITENPLTPSSLLVGFPTCNNTVPSRFGVQNDIHTTAGYFESTTSTLPMILGIHANVTNTGGRAIGVDALVASTGSHTIALSGRAVDNSIQAPVHIGLDAHAANATSQSFAVNGDVKGSSSPFNYGYQTEINSGTNPSAVSYGVYSTITNNGATNYAGYFMATGAATNYGIFASALPGSGQQPPSGPNYAGFFDGDVVKTGTDNFTSDVNLKQNIQPIINATAIIDQLSPKNFYFNPAVHPNMVLPSGKQWGLIAQDVEPILPELVSTVEHPAQYDSLGNLEYAAFTFKTLNYQAFTGILIQAVKEQNSKIDSLQISNDSLHLSIDSLINVNNNQDNLINDLNNRLSHLENCLSGILPILCQMSHQSIQTNSPEIQQAIRSQLEIYLQNKEAIILDQNVPNPFAEQTVINFSIPESVKSAQIFFYDGMGKLIKTVDIRERGLGSITVFGSDLSSGTYMYTLVADGVNVATKKMVKE